ncbi:NAD(P)-dependent oxidoreductase [Streptomyces sp. NPDC050610]|uniref:NAD-dependent epimerase/dehydratase family protein n=1 Tax=Streptomyces sp. NPDC050610 TaxID=3157097 RepID=UPI00341641FF
MRILVLGAGGFLGGHTIRELRALPGARVTGGGRTPARTPGNGLTVDLAAADGPGFADALRTLAPDTVVNCAGATGGSPVHLTGTNARGPAFLCEALQTAAPEARLIHLGSAAEYGAPDGPRPSAESDPARPLGLYGATKLAGTLAVAESPLDAVVLRVFNPVGPYAPGSTLPGRLAAELRRAGPDGPVAVGDLSACRDFVDARDVARAVALAVTATGPLPRVINVGSGTARPARALAEGLARAAGHRGGIDEGGQGSRRSAAVPWQQADISTARTALGWTPRHTLDDSLADLWAAHDHSAEPAR